MVSKISRRVFILSALASVATASVGGWWVFKVSQDDNTDLITAILRKNLGYLNLDEAGLVAFAHDFQTNIDTNNRKMYLLSLARPIYATSNLFEMTPMKNEVRKIEERIINQFLMSSDFFWRGADETQTVTYLGYYDPYKNPCANPFASRATT